MRWFFFKIFQHAHFLSEFFYDILPKKLESIDEITPYIPGSPCGSGHNRNVGADFVGDTHLWGVWHGLKPMKYYRRRMTRFCSEFGFESLPSFKMIKAYAKPEDYNLDSAVQRSHQKCAGGNDKMLYYVSSRFNLSDDIEDLVYLSQVTQQECIADATEHWRRNKGRCNGAMYWQLNDCWPTCSWSGFDYSGEYKALTYAARNFNAPLSVSIEDDKNKALIYVLNDFAEDKDVKVEWYVFDFDGKIKDKQIKELTVKAVSNEIAFTVSTKNIDAKRSGIAVKLYEGDVCIMQKTLLLKPEKKLSLPVAPIEITESNEGGKRKITLVSPVYQRLVMLSNDCGAPFSDNFFDLLPNEPKVVYQNGDIGTVTAVKSVANLKKTKFINVLKARIKVFLNPQNIANAIYHGRVPKQYVEKD